MACYCRYPLLLLLGLLMGCGSSETTQVNAPQRDPVANDESTTSETMVPAAPAVLRDQPPRPIKHVSPKYPEALVEQNMQGTVEVAFTVTEAGDVTHAEVLSSPDEAFSKAALEAIEQWKFSPAIKDGQPSLVRITMAVAFKTDS